ncbi:MAG: hypothetical protein KDA89_11160 [Planctomycetaceae bacterium]|nr:hypothetical protein [Planctomycetaceae bacterium]
MPDMSTASHPSCLNLSAEKFATALPRPNVLVRSVAGLLGIPLAADINSPEDTGTMLRDGDARAAVVVQTNPVIAAAYSDEFDSVLLLRIPDKQCAATELNIGTRLIAVFNYRTGPMPRDITFGERAGNRFQNAEPLIGDLLSDDLLQLQKLKDEIPEAEWNRAARLGEETLRERPRLHRLHRPGSTHRVAGDLLITILAAVIIVVALVIGLWQFA